MTSIHEGHPPTTTGSNSMAFECSSPSVDDTPPMLATTESVRTEKELVENNGAVGAGQSPEAHRRARLLQTLTPSGITVFSAPHPCFQHRSRPSAVRYVGMDSSRNGGLQQERV